MKTFKYIVSISLLVFIFFAFLVFLFSPYFIAKKDNINGRISKVRLVSLLFMTFGTIVVIVIMTI